MSQLCPDIGHSLEKQLGVKFARQSSRNKDELMRDVFLWTPTHGHTSGNRLTKSFMGQLCPDIGHSLENQLGVTYHRVG